MDNRVICCADGRWVELAQDRFQWQALIVAALNLQHLPTRESLRIKPTDAMNSSFIGISILHVSGSLSAHHHEFLAYIGFGTLYAVVTFCYQGWDGDFSKNFGDNSSFITIWQE
jgi:hypothetical protein